MGLGDAVTPEPETAVFPALLQGCASPKLRVYPVYTVIAEKYHAMVILELANSRMKDFYDLLVIAQRTDLQGDTLAQAIAATFKRRATALPTERPLALTSVFHQDAAKQLQWKAFAGKNRLNVDTLEQVVILLERLLWHPTQAALEQAKPLHWKADSLEWQ